MMHRVKPTANEPRGDWFEVRSGIAFDFQAMSTDMIRLEDIAHSLARTCRYNGHTIRHYSVAEHCIILADWVAKQGWASSTDVLTALLHDATECYIGDMISPIKQKMPDFKKLETMIDELVAERYGTIYPFPDWLKEADTRILHDERLAVRAPSDNVWQTDALHTLGVKFMPIRGRCAWLMEKRFIQRFNYWERALRSECGLG